jgi:hypothetical protein
VRASSRGVGVLAAGLGEPRGDSGLVCLLASYDDDDAGVLDAAAALARKTAAAAAATMSSLFGGAVSLAGAVTKKLPLGGALGGAAAGTASHADDDARPLTWRSAWIDPPRRTRRFAPAPRGPLVAAADGLGRVVVLDVAAPASLAAARVLKGCRDAEVAWVEAPPPRGSNARVAAATGGLGALFLAVRSPKRNGGAVELWRFGGGERLRGERVRDDEDEDPEPTAHSREPPRMRASDPDARFRAARLTQAATPVRRRGGDVLAGGGRRARRRRVQVLPPHPGRNAQRGARAVTRETERLGEPRLRASERASRLAMMIPTGRRGAYSCLTKGVLIIH